jgi:uncharacterized protein
MAALPVLFDIEPAAPAQVEPTIRGRVHTYDLIRGVAILGILLANIPYFAGPGFADMDSVRTDTSPLDLEVSAWTSAFVSGKYRSMLAILFGIGMWLQFERRSKVEGNWPWGYIKRMLILAVFGLCHWILIWPGDILMIYAIAALATFWGVGKSDKFQKRFALTVGGIAAIIGILALVGAITGSSFDDGRDPDRLTLAAEIAAFGSGSYLDQLQFRAQVFVQDAPLFLLFVPFLTGLYFLGIQLGKYRTLENPGRNAKARRNVLGLGIGIGLPFNLICGALLSRANEELVIISMELFFGPLLAVGFIMLLAMWGSSHFLPGMQSSIAKVGRTAFSCYIMQSLICTAIFYSWGGGQYGKLDRLESLAIVPIVWAANLAFAHFWLKKYAIGPLEWLWRSLTEGRKLPIKVSS